MLSQMLCDRAKRAKDNNKSAEVVTVAEDDCIKILVTSPKQLCHVNELAQSDLLLLNAKNVSPYRLWDRI